MNPDAVLRQPSSPTFNRVLISTCILLASAAVSAFAQDGSNFFAPGNLVISRSVDDNNPNNV